MVDGLFETLKHDPRPSYQNDTREYKMNFAGYNVGFSVENDILTITKIDKI